ncbi:hypothetical protein ACHAXN_006123 [Cyclotella atomus]
MGRVLLMIMVHTRQDSLGRCLYSARSTDPPIPPSDGWKEYSSSKTSQLKVSATSLSVGMIFCSACA